MNKYALQVTQERNENRAKEFEKGLLNDSWNREVRMKNIWRAIENHTNAAHSACKSYNTDCNLHIV